MRIDPKAFSTGPDKQLGLGKKKTHPFKKITFLRIIPILFPFACLTYGIMFVT
jgi:hypothetical protein